jgi:hypothetical protein
MRTVAFGALGDAEFDPTSPCAYLAEGRTGVLGEMPVRLRAEGKALVAYGYGGQRVEIPARSIRQVWIHPEFEGIAGERVRGALLVLDGRQRVLLRAPGVWGPGVRDVCQRLELNKQPVVLGAMSAGRKVPSLTDAESCQRLRVRSARGRFALTAATLGRAALCVAGAVGGVLLGRLLPASVGDARTLVTVGLGVAGALFGVWLYNAGSRLAAGLIRWAVASRRAGSPAPAREFLHVSGTSKRIARATSAVLAAAVPVLVVWGAVIEAGTLSRGGTLTHGAALGNVIAGALAILIAPPLALLAFRRIRAARRRVGDDFTSDLA